MLSIYLSLYTATRPRGHSRQVGHSRLRGNKILWAKSGSNDQHGHHAHKCSKCSKVFFLRRQTFTKLGM